MAAVISDASPLVHLAAIKRFDLLRLLYSVVFIPKAVWTEVVVAGLGRPGSTELDQAITSGWMQIKEAGRANLARSELVTLDQGEAEALALALDLQAEVILLDEVRGRAVARTLGLRAVGTLGVLIEAKRRGLIASFRQELDRLTRDSQLQLSDEIKNLALKLAREDG
jgi:predicted nucleic acid-binding protein